MVAQQCLPPQLEGLPGELRERPQWVVHRGGAPYAARNTARRNGRSWGKGSKTDYTNPANMSTFEEAWQLYLAGGWDGVGYCLLASDPFLLVDIDHCLRADGTLAPTVDFWVQRLGGYVERSPGGDGVHVIVEARLVRLGSIYWLREESLHETFKVECYDQKRFVRLTGTPLPGRALGAITQRQDVLDAFVATMAPEREGRTARSNGHRRPAPDWQPERISPPLDDQGVLARARTVTPARTPCPAVSSPASP